MKLARLPMPRTAFACLALACGALACADKANPVIPSTPPIPGGQTGRAGDAAVSEAGTVADTAPLANTDAATVVVCDLLKQDCSPDPITSFPRACYPASGNGRCAPAGNGPTGSGCTFHTDCLRGLACVTAQRGLSFLQCQPICDPGVPLAATDCASDQECAAFGTTSKAGYCQTP